ncbi:MAG TPA: FlgD immunoglobulin-like domain containing protein, partial [Armatimonadota bacterium]
MFNRSLRWIVSSASVALMLLFVTSAAMAQTASAFRVTSILPSPFSPSLGQSTTATYTVPVLCNLRIAVRNSAGTEIRQIVNYVGMPAGTRTRVWDGKDRNGVIVPNGVYTIFVEGKTSSGAAIATGSAPVTVGATTTPPTPTTGAFKVTGITPSSFDASKAQTATIAYTVPVLSTVRVAVRNSAGTEIRQIISSTGVTAGSYTRVWDGKNTSGLVVADGVYTVAVSGASSTGTALTTATGTVTVATTTVTPPPPTPTAGGDLGQLVEGCGRANYDWFKS